MRKFVQPVAITVPTYLKWCDLANQMILLGYRAFDQKVFDMGFPYQMFTDIRNGDPIFGLLSASYSDWSDARLVLCDNTDMFLALAVMSEGPEFWPGEWVCDKSTGSIYGECINQIDKKVEIKNLVGTVIVLPKLWIRKATKEEIIAHFETAMLASDIPESQRFTIDQAKEIIAKSLSIPVEQIEIDGR